MEVDEQDVANRAMMSVDIIEKIFRHFNAYELSNVMKVCRLWRDEGRKEFARRRSPEILFLRDFCSLHLDESFPYHEIMNTNVWNNRNCARLINMIPQMSVTFCRVPPAIRHTAFTHMLHSFEWCSECFSGQKLVYRSSADTKFFTVNVRHACTGVNNQFRNITTLFLPQMLGCRLYLCWLSYAFVFPFTEPSMPFPAGIGDVFLSKERNNYCLILLENKLYNNQGFYRGRSYMQFRETFFRALSQSYRQGIAVWGGRATCFVPALRVTGNPLFAGFEFSGEHLRFFSLHLSSLPHDTIETNNKLARFKSQLRLRSQALGLLMYHQGVLDHKILMEVTFPNIKFIYIQLNEPIHEHDNREMNIFSVDSLEAGEFPDLRRPETDSAILIITYD